MMPTDARTTDPRDDFLEIVSHELKTPVASLQLQLQLLKRQLRRVGDREISIETFVHEIDASLKQVSLLTYLINDLLEVSRIRHGVSENWMPMQTSKMNFSTWLTEVSERYFEMLNASGCRLQLNIDTDVTASFDPARMEQVFANLVANVCKFAPGSHVNISLTAHEGGVRFDFGDDGPGVPREHRAKIFDRFARGQASVNESGLGLGLFITKAIVEAHGGSIQIIEGTRSGLHLRMSLPQDLSHPVHLPSESRNDAEP